MTPIKIMAGVVGLASLLAMFTMTRIPVPEKAIVIDEAKAQDRFDEAWIDTMKPLVLKSADMERVKAVANDPRPIPTERILVEPVTTKAPPVVLVEETKPPKHKRVVSSDVCVRHKLRKVTIGKKWRCRK